MEKTGCKIICGAHATLAVKGLMMMMMCVGRGGEYAACTGWDRKERLYGNNAGRLEIRGLAGRASVVALMVSVDVKPQVSYKLRQAGIGKSLFAEVGIKRTGTLAEIEPGCTVSFLSS